MVKHSPKILTCNEKKPPYHSSHREVIFLIKAIDMEGEGLLNVLSLLGSVILQAQSTAVTNCFLYYTVVSGL